MTCEQIRTSTPEIETKATSSTTSFITLGNNTAADAHFANTVRAAISAGFQLLIHRPN